MRYILLLIFTSICLLAEVAKVSAVVGDAKIQRDNKSIIVKIGTLVEEKDIIHTQKNSKVQLIFNDNTIVTLGKNSALNINEYIYDTKNPKNSKTDFNFFKGAFKAITGKIGKVNKEKFKLRTKNSTIGIRGTVILANQTTVMCLSGEISVSAEDNQVIVPQNQVTKVEENGELSTPTEYTQETLQELSNSLEPQDDSDSATDDSTANNSESSETNESDEPNDGDEENKEESSSTEEEKTQEESNEESQSSEQTNEDSTEESQSSEQNSSASTDESTQTTSDDSTADSEDTATLSSSETQSDDTSSSTTTQSTDTTASDDTTTVTEDSSFETTSLDDSTTLSTSSTTTTDTTVSQTTDDITQTVQDASDDSNETETEQTTISFNYRGNSLGAYVESSSTTTASTNSFIHQDNTSADGTVGIFRATRVDNKVTFDENFSRIFANSDKKNISKTLDRTFSLGTPKAGGYTGYSDITDNANPISFSYTSTGNVSLSGNYKVIVDNMGEVFVLYYDGSTFDVPGGTAEYNELIVFGKNALINQADKSKIYVYKDLVSMRVEKDSSGNFTESKLDTNETGFEYYNANLKSMTHINKDVHSQGAEEFIVGYEKSIKVYRNKYNFTYNGSALNLSSYNYGNTEANIDIFGTDYQAIAYKLSTTDNTKTYSSGSESIATTKSENSGASFLQKDKIQTAKTTGTANLKGFINADAYSNNAAKTNLRQSSSNLTLNINRESGNITGNASVGTTSGSTANGVTLKFTGDIADKTSYYINDDIFGVMIDKGDSNYKVGADEYDLNDNTGYLIAVPDGAFDNNGAFKLFDSDDNPLTSDDDSSWGYWTGKFSDGSDEVFISPFATWVAGIETPTSIVQEALDATSNTRYTFEGAVIGTVLNGSTGNLETIVTDGSKTNSIKMNFDLGGGSNSLTNSTVNFSTTNTTWGMNIQGQSITSSGFSGTLSNSVSNGNSITGSVVGKFYGSDKIKSVGGTISATQDVASGVAHKAQGVFKALKK